MTHQPASTLEQEQKQQQQQQQQQQKSFDNQALQRQ
jgi:hypothetical protein